MCAIPKNCYDWDWGESEEKKPKPTPLPHMRLWFKNRIKITKVASFCIFGDFDFFALLKSINR